MKRKKFIRFFLTVSFLVCHFPGLAGAGQCYIGKETFGVSLPYFKERVCHYFFHEIRTYSVPPRESEYAQTLPDIELHADPLHISFVKMLQDRKFVSMKKGTPVFSCQYDLETLKNDPQQAALQGMSLPEFNCRGAIFRFVPVRPVNFSICYWVAIEDVVCPQTENFPLFAGSDVHEESDSPAISGKVEE
jgi:hypothetical protein